MALLNIFGFGNKTPVIGSAKLNFSLNIATQTTEVAIGSTLDKTTGSAQVAVAVKAQDSLGKVVDVATHSIFAASKDGATIKSDVGVKVLDGPNKSVDVVSISTLDANKDGAAIKNDVGVKVLDGPNKSVDVVSISALDADKDGAAIKNDVGVKVIDGPDKSVDVVSISTLDADKDGAAIKNDVGVKVIDGLDKAVDVVSISTLDADKDGAAIKNDVGVKVTDGLDKAVDVVTSSSLDANKGGATGETDLGLAIQNGTRSGAALFDALFSADSLSFASKTGVEAQGQGAQSKFSLAGLSLFAADNTGTAAQNDIGMLVHNAQKVATLKVSDLLQIGQQFVELASDRTLNVESQASASEYQPLHYTGALDLIIPLHQETALV
ncbi:hypothetical protein [Pseudomonas nitroreducens]|uniref:Uncharacterized protein n=1 Tax=Pseudomonas nitroreducens TaxID=46680 RepID=A0A246F6Z9_PSENT|nr:hypothetical protein [Pseudomonas nitroreducens]OWP48966.1 hypothetical protein CEG18_19695 [Pseudomonas nitroreducens]